MERRGGAGGTDGPVAGGGALGTDRRITAVCEVPAAVLACALVAVRRWSTSSPSSLSRRSRSASAASRSRRTWSSARVSCTAVLGLVTRCSPGEGHLAAAARKPGRAHPRPPLTSALPRTQGNEPSAICACQPKYLPRYGPSPKSSAAARYSTVGRCRPIHHWLTSTRPGWGGGARTGDGKRSAAARRPYLGGAARSSSRWSRSS